VHLDNDLAAAPATPLVLTILSEGESYGYAILKRLRELSGGEFEWADAMVYPLFHRLRRLGYLTTEWRALPEGRRRYYAITDDGRAALARRQHAWATTMRALSGMWRGPGSLLMALWERDGSPSSPMAGRHATAAIGCAA
jgi:PadR family transcriptional regulator, regulatory protein PadR